MNLASAGGNRSAIGFSAAGPNQRALVRGRQKAGAPVARPVGGEAARVGQHDERRQVVGQAAQAVARPRRPCSESRAARTVFCMNVAGPWTFDLETIEWMNAMSSTHSARCGTRSLIHLPHWPYCFQSQGLAMQSPGRALKQLDLLAGVERLAVALDQLGLVVERVALAGRARHEELHDALGLGADDAGRPSSGPARRRVVGQQTCFGQQVRQRNAAQAAAEVPEELAARRRRVGAAVLAG